MKTRIIVSVFLWLTTTIAAIAQPQTADVFVNGTKWYQSFFPAPDGEPKPEETYIEYYLDGETEMLGHKCLKLWRLDSPEASERVFVTYVRAEGEKVFFLYGEKATDWDLMYDFGLQVGESCTVTYPNSQWDDTNSAHPYKIKCTEIRPSVDYPGMEEILFVYDNGNDSIEKTYPDAIWIKGVGSIGGLLTNVFLDGAPGGNLLKASNASDIICENATLSINKTEAPEFKYEINDRNVILRGVQGSSISIYGIDGRCVHHSSSTTDTYNVRIPETGIYILTINSQSTKISIR